VFDYTGYNYDRVLDKYFAQARFYDPVNKRFTQPDPIQSGANLYAYVDNNPITYIDPLGLAQQRVDEYASNLGMTLKWDYTDSNGIAHSTLTYNNHTIKVSGKMENNRMLLDKTNKSIIDAFKVEVAAKTAIFVNVYVPIQSRPGFYTLEKGSIGSDNHTTMNGGVNPPLGSIIMTSDVTYMMTPGGGQKYTGGIPTRNSDGTYSITNNNGGGNNNSGNGSGSSVIDTIGSGIVWIGGKIYDGASDVVNTTLHGMDWVASNVLKIDTAEKGAYILNMFKDSNGIYHASTDAWQQIGGYNSLYDAIFDFGTSMETYFFQFSCGENNYRFWAWKGDYINLGAGAELGIYQQMSVADFNTPSIWAPGRNWVYTKNHPQFQASGT
jgi:RHS repeat-associated protein